MNDTIWAELRKPFPPEQIGKLPRVTCGDCSDKRKNCTKHEKAKCGICGAWVSTKHIHIDYVGHADVTSRLLAVDPEWIWEPKAEDEHGVPVFDTDDEGNPVGLWIKLTIGGVTRLGYGSCPSNQSDAVKVLIGDALRNSALRFGVALDLWAKGDRADPAAENATASAGRASRGRQSTGDVFENSRPARPRPASQKPTRPAAVAAVPDAAEPPAEVNDDAQELAREAHNAQVIADLRGTWTRAKESVGLNAIISDPGTGEKMPLVQLIDARRREFEDADAALKEFHAAAVAAGLEGPGEMEEHVKRVTSADFEKATAAQLRQATAALNGEAALDGHSRGFAGGHSRLRLAAFRAD